MMKRAAAVMDAARVQAQGQLVRVRQTGRVDPVSCVIAPPCAMGGEPVATLMEAVNANLGTSPQRVSPSPITLFSLAGGLCPFLQEALCWCWHYVHY